MTLFAIVGIAFVLAGAARVVTLLRWHSYLQKRLTVELADTLAEHLHVNVAVMLWWLYIPEFLKGLACLYRLRLSFFQNMTDAQADRVARTAAGHIIYYFKVEEQ